jgi:hypothetical protein
VPCRGRQKPRHPQPTIRKRFTVTRRRATENGDGERVDVRFADGCRSGVESKAETAKADYYVIIMIDDTMVPGQWYSQAILYRK